MTSSNLVLSLSFFHAFILFPARQPNFFHHTIQYLIKKTHTINKIPHYVIFKMKYKYVFKCFIYLLFKSRKSSTIVCNTQIRQCSLRWIRISLYTWQFILSVKCRIWDKISFACCCGFIIKFSKALWKWRAYIHNGGSHCLDHWDPIYCKVQCWKLTWKYRSWLQRLHFTSTYIFCRQKQRDLDFVESRVYADLQ